MSRSCKKRLVYFGIFPVGLVVLFFLIKPSFQQKIFFGEGGRAWINIPGPFASLHDSFYEIKVEPKVGKEGVVRLRGDFDRSPLLILRRPNTPFILCLYDCDVRLRIIKIYTDRKFQPLPNTSPLYWFIQNSTLMVEQGNADDWKFVLDFLKSRNGEKVGTWIPTLDAGVVRLYASPTSLAERMQQQLSSIVFSYND